MPQTTGPLFAQIDSWLQQVDTVKNAAAPAKPKTAKATKKAGPDGMGQSDHPSDDVDNNTQSAETGERFTENSKDVKQDVPGQAVDETDPKGGGEQDDKQFNIGTTQSATGEQPSVEDDYKGGKDDPGTEHPADAESTGEKYSSLNFKQLLKLAESKANGLLADLATSIDTPAAPAQKKAAQQPQAKPQTTPQAPINFDNADLGMDKIAADLIEQAIRDADMDADLVGSYLHSYAAGRNKQAGDDDADDKGGPPDGDADDAGGGEGGGEGGPPAGGGDPLGGGEAGAVGGGTVMPPVDVGGQPGADVLGDLGAGGPPGAGGDAGGPPGGGEGGEGGMSQEQALQELAMALEELGISPEELAQMAQGQGAKLAAEVKSYKRAGKFQFTPVPKTAAQKQAREQIKDYIRELTGAK